MSFTRWFLQPFLQFLNLGLFQHDFCFDVGATAEAAVRFDKSPPKPGGGSEHCNTDKFFVEVFNKLDLMGERAAATA